MALFDTFSSKKNTANTSTVVAVDSYNRTFNSSRNEANSNNLQIALGATADPFTTSSDSVVKTAVKTAGVLAAVALVLWLASQKRT